MTATYTKAQRQAIAAAFKAAKPRLWDGTGTGKGSRFICWAIDRAETDYIVGSSTAEAAKSVVLDRLGRSNSVEDWLLRKGVLSYQMTSAHVQAHRHAWLDKLIEEFSS